MPLYVTNGKLQLGDGGALAAQRACCCNEEGDDPGDCMCPDFCIYQQQLIAPFQTLATTRVPCNNDDNLTPQFSNRLFGNTDCLPEIPPAGDLSPTTQITERNEVWAPWLDYQGQIAQFIDGYYLASFGAIKWYPELVSQDQPFVSVRTTAVVNYRLFCSLASSAKPEHYLAVSLQVGAFASVTVTSNPVAPVSEFGQIVVIKKAVYLLDSGNCRRDGNRSCLSVPQFDDMRKAYMSSPLEVDVSLDGTSLGAWQEVNESLTGNSSLAQGCFDSQVAASLPLTFRITQRQSCRIVDCNCSTSLDGLKATFEGKEFTLGTEEPYNEFFSGYELVTTHYKDFSGNYVFEKYKVLESPAGTIGDVQFATVYCETDEESDPPVPRWYVRFESICRQFAPDAETKRTEIGYLPCSESAGCAGRAEGDPVPLGSPIDIEEIEGSPETTDGLNACTPPARADLTIFEDCG